VLVWSCDVGELRNAGPHARMWPHAKRSPNGSNAGPFLGGHRIAAAGGHDRRGGGRHRLVRRPPRNGKRNENGLGHRSTPWHKRVGSDRLLPVDWLAGDQLGVRGHIEVRREGDGHVLLLTGDVDAPLVDALEREQGGSELRVVAVDVGGLTYIDSAGLALLVRWARDARREGRPAQIRSTTPRFERVLEVAGLDALFVRV
jgi:anti-anti-sigma factor